MFVCVRVCVCVDVCVCAWDSSTQKSTGAHMSVQLYSRCLYVHIYIYTYTHGYICICTWTCIDTSIHIYIYIYIYIYIHIFIYTYTCIYIYTMLCTWYIEQRVEVSKISARALPVTNHRHFAFDKLLNTQTRQIQGFLWNHTRKVSHTVISIPVVVYRSIEIHMNIYVYM